MSGNRMRFLAQLVSGDPAHKRAVRRNAALAALLAPALCLALWFGAGQPAQAKPPVDKLDLFLRAESSRPAAQSRESVIVRLDGDLTPEREAQLRSLGAQISQRLPIIHSVALRLPARCLARLAALPFVAHVSADVTVHKNDEFTVASSEANIAYSQYNLTGYGVTVAVVDSGLYPNLDLNDSVTGKSRILANVNFVPNTTSYYDACGHGTHVTGIIAGDGAGSSGSNYFHTFYGIARRANIVNVRVLDGSGQASVSTVVSGIQWVVNNKSKYNIRVLNLSAGHGVGDYYANDPLCQAVEAAWKAGIFVVCAAGNTGRLNSSQTSGQPNEGWGTAYGSIQSPGNDPYVITVGATKNYDGNRADDRIATYSSRGPTRLDFILKPDIVAPGNKVISLNASAGDFLATNYPGNDIPWQSYCYANKTGESTRYFSLSGTSMAAPVVAGAAALLLQANSSLTPDVLKARLMFSADKWGFPNGTADACTFGAGYLNIPAALNCAVTPTMYAQSPSLSEDNSGNVNININTALWGTNALWGTGITNLNLLWGLNALWGTNTLASSNALWGTSVWTNNAIWGESAGAADLSPTAINGE